MSNKVAEYKYEGLSTKSDHYYSSEHKEKGIETNEFCISETKFTAFL